jgi:BirA family biotin operon repressor/biotin-[acetyl-CoA-carboxylase] ligase
MASHMATDVDQAWTDLHSLSPGGTGATMPDTQGVAESVIGAVAEALEQFGDTGFEPWRGRWQQRDMLLGRELCIKAEDSWVGTGAGIADDGALLVETARGRIPVYAGDVSVRPLVSGGGAR